MILRAANWRELQHYSKRRPPWIKLHRKLLDNRAFLQLPDASKALAPLLWLLCSESEDGAIHDALSEIAFRLHISEQSASKAIAPLLAAGFFTSEESASAPPAKRKRGDVSEGEREGKPLQGLPPSEREIQDSSPPVAAREERPNGALAHAVTNFASKLKVSQ